MPKGFRNDRDVGSLDGIRLLGRDNDRTVTIPIALIQALASGGVSDGDKGVIVVSGSGAAWTVKDGSITLAMLGAQFTAAGKALLDDADAAAQRTTLGLGTAAVEAAGAFATAGHDHTGTYAPAAHNHDGTYAAAAHTHAGVYAPVASVPNASYRTILDSSGSHIAGRVAGTYGLAQGQPAAISGTGTLYALNTIYINSADYPTLDGVAPKLRVRAQLYVNDVAPTGNFTFGLHPITRPSTSGGAGLCIYTIGAAVAGSAVAQNTPAADSMNTVVGSDFALPANGHYVLGMVTTATVATSSHLHLSVSLQMRNN